MIALSHPQAAGLFAALHHVAAFTVAGTIAAELAVLQPAPSLVQARRLQRIDLLYGVAAGALLAIGLLRVAYFEKGWSYYWHDVFFVLKLLSFLAAGLLSIYPTRVYLSWNAALRGGVAPPLSPLTHRRVRLCLRLEVLALLLIVVCAALMARGFGYRP
ncbi:MAG: DUF2214 family protein [Gammaproteobacteria bacterium]|nr:DUF2214 family protein [Gammaproteobacteria bacterium]MBV9622012.1 DUF2214 family protein [Gammaproteobacteria bacterium]